MNDTLAITQFFGHSLLGGAILGALFGSSTKPISQRSIVWATITILVFVFLIFGFASPLPGIAGWILSAGVVSTITLGIVLAIVALSLIDQQKRNARFYLRASFVALTFCALVPSLLLLTNRSLESFEAPKTSPSAFERQLIISQVIPAISDNFTLVAVNGRWEREPKEGHPIRDFAVFIFTSKLSPALQPESKFSGAMVGSFIPRSDSIQITRIVDQSGNGQPFIIEGMLKVEFAGMFGGKSRKWIEEVPITLNGLISQESHRMVIIGVEPKG